MLAKNEFDALPPGVRNKIIDETLAEANGSSMAHSMSSIVKNERHLAIAARMTSRPLQFTEFQWSSQNLIATGNVKAYTGKDIADIFIDSAIKFNHTYYPLTGDWTSTGVKQLVCFIKVNGIYTPYVRFQIDQIVTNESLEAPHLNVITDPTPAIACVHKSLLQISNPQIANLPQHFLGIRSADDLQKVAFRGSAPNVLMI